MRIAFELIFYIIINLVPGKVDHFQADFKKDDEKVMLEFTREPNNHWKVLGQVKGQKRKEALYFWFDKDLSKYHQKTERRTKTYPFAVRYNIKRNHRKWRKTSLITYTMKSSSTKFLSFKISKQSKHRYHVAPAEGDAELKDFPEFWVYWK
ncbi:hypothetical protein [uncultured Microscilla sp.]|uniref:hypothetical protein n=1 Tax=uncultured Microscilla sp. TaxID=432653 RepID=UPI00260A527C|nr:hypothetical protein [uncultured Microscilla sp.]